MNRSLKRILLSILFILIFGLGLCGLYKVLSWKDTSGDYFSSVNEMKTLPDNTVDAVALGSSRVYGSFNPVVIWDKYGYATFNFSISGMAQESAYYHLKELLKTQSPKVVFLEGSLLYTEDYLDQGNVYRNTIVMAPSKNNLELIESTVAESDVATYMLRFPIVHSRYSEIHKGDFELSNTDQYRLGYVAGFDNESQSPDYSILESSKSTEVSAVTKAWIDKLYKLSVDEGFDLVFYHAPQNLLLYYKALYNGACDYLDTYGIKHIDFNEISDEIGLDYSTDLSDAGHLNTLGGTKVSNYLADFLHDNYELKDNRENADYERWNKCSEYFEHEILENDLINVSKPSEAIKIANENPGYIVVNLNETSIWAYEDGQMFIDSNSQEVEYNEKINSSDYCYIRSTLNGDRLESTVYFGQSLYELEDDYTNMVVIYDRIMDKVVYTAEYTD